MSINIYSKKIIVNNFLKIMLLKDMCHFLKRKIDENKGVLISYMISMIFGVLMLVFRNDEPKFNIFAAIDKIVLSLTTLVILCLNNKTKELNTNLSPIQEGNHIVSGLPNRIRIIENLCKLVILEKKDVSPGKLVPGKEDVSPGQFVPEKEDVSQCKFVPEKEEVSQGKLVPEKECLFQGKLIPEREDVFQGKLVPERGGLSLVPERGGVSQVKIVPEKEGVSQIKIVPEKEGVSQVKIVPEKEGVSQVKIVPEKEGVSQVKIVDEQKFDSQGKMNAERMSTEEERKKDCEIAFLLLSTIYDGEIKICNIIENTKKKKII